MIASSSTSRARLATTETDSHDRPMLFVTDAVFLRLSAELASLQVSHDPKATIDPDLWAVHFLAWACGIMAESARVDYELAMTNTAIGR